MNAGTAVMPPWAYLRLPPFPRIAIRVLQLINDENVQLRQLGELISSDPAFASEVLVIANSAIYAPRYPACTMLQALAVLGADHLQGMCLTVAVRSYLGKSVNHPMIRNLWRHNLACGMVAEQLAAAGFMDEDTAHTAGLLHDMGRLAFAVLRPSAYAEVLQSHRGSGSTILRLEEELFGVDHCQAGRYIVTDWQLPSSFEGVVGAHHEPRREDGAWSMEELFKVSCRMADAAGFPAFPGCEVASFDDLRGELPEREQQRFQPSLNALTNEVASRIAAVESL